MSITPSLYIALAAAAMLSAACGFQHQSSVTAPTQSTPDNAGGGSGSGAPTSGPSYLGTWASNLTVPSASSCGNFQWTVTSQTATTMAGTFSVECAGNITIKGSAQGELKGNSVPMTATGTANIPGIPGCGFSLSGTGTIVDNREITIPYSGTTCFGPVSGTETLRKRTVETPVIEPPQPLSPGNNQRISTLRPTFRFTNAAHSGPVGPITYDIQVSEVFSFETVYAALTVDEQPGTTSVQFGHDGPYDKYFFWRVRGHDASTVGPWSGPEAFDMPASPQAPPPIGGGGNANHVGPGPNTEGRAYQVIQATANEYSRLIAVFNSEDEAVRAADELLRRTIWHLQLAGFQAARQRNPSGAISSDKVTININGGWHAYDIYSLGYAGRASTVQMIEVGGANPVPDPGISD